MKADSLNHVSDSVAAFVGGTVADIHTGSNHTLLILILTIAAPILKEGVIYYTQKLHAYVTK